MGEKTKAETDDAPQVYKTLEEMQLHGRTYKRGDVVQIDGLPGEYKIRRIDLLVTGLEVEVFGGAAGRGQIRQFRAERIVPPDGSPAAVEHRSSTLSACPIREAIAGEGEVRVPLEDDDPKARKRLVNKVFSRAYSLGLKGKFRVRVEDGVVIGWTTEESIHKPNFPDGQ